MLRKNLPDHMNRPAQLCKALKPAKPGPAANGAVNMRSFDASARLDEAILWRNQQNPAKSNKAKPGIGGRRRG
jgi:hypothetical protein